MVDSDRSTIFLTGFPGFLGSALVERLLDRLPGSVSVTCLVQPKYRTLAAARAHDIEGRGTGRAGRIHLVEGDITQPGLGLDPEVHRTLCRQTIECFHLAAVYDLGVSRSVGELVNVNGTRNMLALASCCDRLRRFQYVSTCYVSGRYPGRFSEIDLDKGQQFNNHYEETKFLAEKEVQAARVNGMPVTIYRPAIVVGDSRTGATQKYDGPYYVIQWILRWRRIAPLPVMGDPNHFQVNVVPRDFVVDAIDRLSALETSEGNVYQLTDPHPLTVNQMLDLLEQKTGRRLLRFPVPLKVVTRLSDTVPPLERWTRIEPEAFPYFAHPTIYESGLTTNQLEQLGVTCPSFADYVDTLLDYVRKNPNVASTAMV